MNIAVLGIRGLPANYSGFETCAEHTTKNWINNGHNVLVYCRKNRYHDRPRTLDNINLVYTSQIPLRGIETLSHTLFSILHLLFRNPNYKYIHLYNSGNAIFLPILKIFNKKVLISVDGIEWKRDKWGSFAKLMYKIGEWCAVKFADAIIVDNKEIENYYSSRFSINTSLIAYGAKIIGPTKGKSKTILNRYDLEEKKYFIFVGRLVPEKGVHELIGAYKKLETDYPLVIIGDDHSNSEYKRNLFTFNSTKIKMVGFKYGEEYEQLLANALIYVSASK